MSNPPARLLDDYLKTDTLASAKRLLTDNGLKIVSGVVGVTGLWEPNPNFAENLDAFRKRCEQFAELGAPLVYSPCATSAKFTQDDYEVPGQHSENSRGRSPVQNESRCRVRTQFHIPGLVTNGAAAPSRGGASEFGVLFDCYHSGRGRASSRIWHDPPGEIIHAHLNDTQDLPRELLDLQTRVIPGDGVAPLARILQQTRGKRLCGPDLRRVVPTEIPGG